MSYESLRVLVVDDHMLVRSMVVQTLRSLGVNDIETAGDGEAAVKEMKLAADVDKPYRLVFLDWHMPGLDGIEAMKILRQEKRYDKTAIVMLTAEQEKENVAAAISEGATSYIVKPVSREVMEQNLQRALKWIESRK